MTRSRSDSPRVRLAPDRLDDPVARRDADVRGDQRLFERLERLEVDRAAALRRLVGAPDDLVEPLDELFLGAGEDA